jgi:hypothetical protein
VKPLQNIRKPASDKGAGDKDKGEAGKDKGEAGKDKGEAGKEKEGGGSVGAVSSTFLLGASILYFTVVAAISFPV